MQVERVGQGFVAEIGGIDLSQPLADDDAKQIHDAYLEHQLLIFHDQDVTPGRYAEFAKMFGAPEPHSVVAYHHPDNPAITILSNRIHKGKPKGIRDAGSHWHSDYSYKKVTANATLLYALEVPGEGGDTLFGDLAAAYETLPEETKTRIAGLKARQQYRWTKDRGFHESRWELCTADERRKTPEIIHPIVRTHPETGRKGLYVFPGITSGVKGIVGMDGAESERLLQSLFAHIQQERFIYRFKWRKGDLIVFDNRTLMHHATTSELPGDHYRTLLRINTSGSIPF